MKLPNHNKAIIDLRKIENYCLNPHHPVGKHKARMFKAFLGISQKDSKKLKTQILETLNYYDAEKSYEDKYGIRYFVSMKLNNEGKKATVVTVWIVREDSEIPHLVTCYVKT